MHGRASQSGASQQPDSDQDVLDNGASALQDARAQDSDSRYRRIFEGVRVSLWEEDFSEVLGQLELLKAQGIADLRSHLAGRPELVAQIAGHVRTNDVNQYTLELFEAPDKEELRQSPAHLLGFLVGVPDEPI